MTEFEDSWESTEVKVAAPNDQVWITVRGNVEIRIAVDPGYYARATPAQIEHQLTQAARLALPARTKEFYRLRSREAGELRRPSTSIAPRAVEYREALSRLFVEGTSGDGSISCQSIGLSTFTITIAPGTYERLDAGSFSAGASEAATALLHDQLSKAVATKREIYQW